MTQYFVVYARQDLAEVRVTQPESIAGLYDAGQALFNPDSHPGVTGTRRLCRLRARARLCPRWF